MEVSKEAQQLFCQIAPVEMPGQPGSFGVATIEGLSPDNIKTALMRYSPPQAIAGHATPYLYKFNVADTNLAFIKDMPAGPFEGMNGGSGKEYVATTSVSSSEISAYIAAVEGWQPLGADFNEQLKSAIIAKRAKEEKKVQ